MPRGAFAGARRSAWRSRNIVALLIGATGFGLAAAASAETRGMPLIRIPPAQLPPLGPLSSAICVGGIPYLYLAQAETIRGLPKTRDGEIDGELAISLARHLSAETDRPWRVVAQSDWK